MDEDPVTSQFLNSPRSIDELPENQQRLLRSPAWRSNQQEYKDAVIRGMLENVYSGRFGFVRVARRGSHIKIDWGTHILAGPPEDYLVTGLLRVIDFIPDARNLIMGMIARGGGKGTVSLRLEEGSCYSFVFHFVNKSKASHKIDEDSVNYVHFAVGIPLSLEKQLALKRALKLMSNPGERVRNEFETFFNAQEAFDEMREQGIRRIKAKGLAADEEQMQIADFEDYAKDVKDKYGI